MTKENVTRLKMQNTEWEKIFVIYVSDNGLVPIISDNSRKKKKKELSKNQ
jgi:hypothetical protein